jgi:murein DD-endopeptidase MepM/ murein hydrolase activator NlpD
MTCPPTMPPVSFTDRFVGVNHLEAGGFQRWSFQPGMLFAATTVWWPTPTPARSRPHEGLDLATFVDNSGNCRSLTHGAMVPVLAEGEVVEIFDDFLGKSILVAHHGYRQGGAALHSIYAHCRIEAGVSSGYRCHGGEIIGRIAANSRGPAPAHLHLSTLWLKGRMDGGVSWPRINNAPNIRMCDPLAFIGVSDDNP